MSPHIPYMQPIAMIRSAFNSLINHPVILFPFCILAFIQGLFIELIYFAPRWPLSIFFEPLIIKRAGEAFLHYPYNYLLLYKWFQHPIVQVPIFIVVGSFCLGACVYLIDKVNSGKTIKMKDVFRNVLALYIHLFVAAVIYIIILFFCHHLFGLVVKRAAMIRSVSGGFFLIKQLIFVFAPYIKLFIGAFITALFAFVVPLIVLEKKKVFSAYFNNFKLLRRNFFIVCTIVILPALLYIPILLLKTNMKLFFSLGFPELWGFMLVFSVIVAIGIEALQFASITTCYLLKRES